LHKAYLRLWLERLYDIVYILNYKCYVDFQIAEIWIMQDHIEIISEIEPLDEGKPEPLKDRAQPRSYRRRPLKAWRHFQKLLANKEDTEQVFHIIQALNGKVVFKDFKAFKRSNAGAHCLEQRRDLPAILDDHARWKALPTGTVGRAYVDFMEREGLSAHMIYVMC